ncbi:MAG: HU family DNA-binding protein [Acidimicrobiales bacterium]
MNKAEFVAALARHTSVEQKTVSQVLEGMEDVIGATVKKGEKVMLTGFAAFERTDRKARKGRNPATGEPIRIKASKGVRVTPGSTLRKVVNGEAPAAKLARVAPSSGASKSATPKVTAPARAAKAPVANSVVASRGRTERKAAAPATKRRATRATTSLSRS